MHPTTRRTIVFAAAIALPLTVFALWRLFWPVNGWMDSYGYLAGRDFLNFWFAPHLALQGRLHEVYDLGAYHAALQREVAAGSPFLNFSYPPSMLLLLLPLGAMPYGVAYAVWVGLGLAAFVFAAMGGWPARRDAWFAGLLLVSPAVLASAVIGQAALVLAFLLVAGLRLVPTRPVLAGVLFGLLTVKPQLGLLLPLVLGLRGEWRAFGAAAVTAALLFLASVAAFGTGAWHDYVTVTMPFQHEILVKPTGFVWNGMVSIYAFLFKLGVPVSVALAVHAVAAGVIVLAALAVVMRGGDWSLTVAVVALASVLVTPYLVYYDLAIPAAGLIWYLMQRREPLPIGLLGAVALFWVLPVNLIVLDLLGLAVMAPVLVALFALLVREAFKQPAGVTGRAWRLRQLTSAAV